MLHGDGAATSLRPVVPASASTGVRREPVAHVARQIACATAAATPRSSAASPGCCKSEGRVPFAALVTLAGLGERQLQRRFAEVVGISPRALGVVIRLRRVFEALREAPLATWSERAQAAGFFDHPQMARDFRRLIGKTPARWASAGPGLAAASPTPTPEGLSQTYKPRRPCRPMLRNRFKGSPMRPIALLLAAFSPAAAYAAPAPDLSWMSGDWRRCLRGEIVEERWLGPRGDLMIGANLTSSKGGKAT